VGPLETRNSVPVLKASSEPERGWRFSFSGKSGKPPAPFLPKRGLDLAPALDLDGLEIDDCRDDGQEEKLQPHLEVAELNKVPECQGGEAEQKKREVGQEILLQDLRLPMGKKRESTRA